MKMTSKTIFRLNGIFTIFFLLGILDVKAQDTIITNEEPMIKVDEMPRFPGCEDLPSISERNRCATTKMLEYIATNLKYPDEARKRKTQGQTVIQFVVKTDGTLDNITIVRDIGDGCGEAAKKVIESMNHRNIRWIPGKHMGKSVNTRYTLPVKFKLGY